MANETDLAIALLALNHIDSNCPREEWIKAGMAAKAIGLPFEDFHDWSKNADNYKDRKDCEVAWMSFKESGAITGGTLFHIAKKYGWQNQKISIRQQKTLPQKKTTKRSKNLDPYVIWEQSLPALANHNYIMQKNGIPDGLRYYPATEPQLMINGKNVENYLVVPCWKNDELQTLQFIPPTKGDKKLNLPGASFNDGYFTVGVITDLIYVVEGIGHTWAIFRASGKPAAVCFSCTRMKAVVKALKTDFPTIHLILLPDRGKEEEAKKIATEFLCQWIELPHEMPLNSDINDYAQTHGHEALNKLLQFTKTPELHYKLLSGETILNTPSIEWVIKGVIPTKGLAAIYGASGSGKSFLVLDMAFSIASGEPHWFGLQVKKMPVTYVCLEGEAGIGKRIKAWTLYCNKSVPNDLRFVIQPFNLLGDDVSELARAITTACGVESLVIIDTLNRASPNTDENSSVDMGKIIVSSSKLQNTIGGVVLLVHHSGKDETKKLRGHSSLLAALDGAIEVANSNNRREWHVAKSKDDVTGQSYSFRLEIISFNEDNKGEKITSCIVIPNESIENGMRHVLPPNSGNQKIIWQALLNLFNDTTYFGQAGAPKEKSCIRLEDAIEKTKDRLLCEQKRQRERARTAIQGLVNRGLLIHAGGWLWLN
ncbi:MAG: AAA family ATPase [Gammaproteobacteria bacterium]|nr:AAA family ATPase [Gammaproteobacteria bacterium]MCW5582941.1 AAA family ATPase [Gammaproteobacteria bacterium]